MNATSKPVLDVGLVACSRMKLEHAAPARELYCSPLFRAARMYAEARYGAGHWLILSARYGLVDPERIIEPYDLTLRHLSGLQREVWGERVAAALAERFGPSATLWFHAGAVYRLAVVRFVSNPVHFSLAGLRIGQQLAWYQNALLALPTTSAPGSADPDSMPMQAIQ